MPDHLAKLANAPSCMMAVYPDGDGSWISPLHVGVSGWPQVSATMRNFSTENSTWHLLGLKQQDIGDGENGTFYIDFDWHYDGSPGGSVTIMSATLGGLRFHLNYSFSGYFAAATNLLGSGVNLYRSIDLKIPGSPLARGRHTVTLRVVGTTFYAKLDAETEKSTTGTRNTGVSFLNPTTTADMYIYNAWMRNDTTGKTVWKYPTWPELVRLLTFTNCRRDRGYFESAQSGTSWTVKTALSSVPAAWTALLRDGSHTYAKTSAGNVYVDGVLTAGAIFPFWNGTHSFTGTSGTVMHWAQLHNYVMNATEIAIAK